jgi:hypothetical protein
VGKTRLVHWVVRIVFLLLQLSPLLRYIDTLIYGIQSKIIGSSFLYRRMLDEDTNSALLRLYHCFLHAAPQAIIQMMILLIHVSHPEKVPLNIGRKSDISRVLRLKTNSDSRCDRDPVVDGGGSPDVHRLVADFVPQIGPLRAR